MDYITIDNLRVQGIHGCHKYEQTTPQTFLVSLKVASDLTPPANSDELADTIDFDFLKNTVTSVFAQSRRHLIETLANEIASAILADARAKEVTVTIQKPDVWQDAVPGVSISRSR